MTNYLRRAQSAVSELLRGRRDDPTREAAAIPDATPIPCGDNLAIVGGAITFVDVSKAASDPTTWLPAFEAAVARRAPVSDEALRIVAAHAHRPADEIFPDAYRRRFLELLRPRPGLSDRLADLARAGLLTALFPEMQTSRHALLAILTLERLLTEATLAGERFGSMLGELSRPELVVLSLLLHDAGGPTDEHEPESAARAAHGMLERLRLDDETRGTIGFLILKQLQMSEIALRHDTGDSGVVASFASHFGTEEQLKMLCLMTVADLGALGPKMLTPWKAELLWRLFVDAYNQMTMTYGDEVIDSHDTALTTVRANRPHDISDAEMAGFLEGLPRRYLTLFPPDSIYRHVRLWRNMDPTDVHFFLNRKSDVWELTVVTLDKPYLFSNICGVLSYLDLDILRGHALTSRNGLVVDVFQCTDHKGCLVRPALDPLLSDVVAGRADMTTLLQGKEPRSTTEIARHAEPVIYFDTESSPRYTILELVTDDEPGLLHGISRVLSVHGCVVDLVLISTEARRAIDVFHLRKDSSKLSDADQLALTQDLERLLESPVRQRP